MKKYSTMLFFLVVSLLLFLTPVIAQTPTPEKAPAPTSTPQATSAMELLLFCSLAFAIVIIIFLLFKYSQLNKRFSQVEKQALEQATMKLEEWKRETEQNIREDAAKRSRAVSVGQMTEHLAPYLPDFTFNPKEVRFIGTPIDLLVFDGLDDGEIRDIIFVEIKTGKSRITPREKLVKEAVMAGKVQWFELRVTNEGIQ